MADHVPHGPQHLQALDLLSLLVAVLRTDGSVLYANAALEQQLGMSRRTLEGADFTQFFTDPALLQTALAGTSSNDFAALRYEASLRRLHQDPVPVHVNVAPTDTRGEVLVELWPLEQQVRQDREERLLEQAQAHKELIRNLAHEIKNPLGGIRGAAQLLEQSVPDSERELTELICEETDRIVALVDRMEAFGALGSIGPLPGLGSPVAELVAPRAKVLLRLFMRKGTARPAPNLMPND